MRKYLSLLLCCALIFLAWIPISKASSAESILIYSTATNGAQAVSTSTIIPGKHRILGFDVGPEASGSGTIIVALYDAATAAQVTAANLIAEGACANTATYSKTFPGPKSLSNGLTIDLSSGTWVTVYYERTIP